MTLARPADRGAISCEEEDANDLSPSVRGVEGRRYGFVGGAKGARTPDLLNAIQTLFQLSYSPTPERER
jgi:hypothetical protein